jgi:TonB-dependent SusC/RagA subfamily outer membrane receptor
MKNFGADYFFEKEIQVQKVVYPRLLSKIDFKRESYSPGDTVKAELTVSTLQNVPLSFKEAKVDFSLAGEKVHSVDIQTNNKGKAMLQFLLPENLKSGDGLVNVKIMHAGNMEAISRSIPIVLNRVEIGFYPEGGYMVANVASNIAFKAVNEYGKPTEVEGYITDNNQNRILEFSSFHQGMGVFELTPVPGKRYYAVITKPNTGIKYELPDVMPRGYTLKMIPLGKNRYQIQYSVPSKERIHLVVQAGNSVYFSKSERAKEGINEITFSAGEFPTGMAMLTLFSQNGTPRCERLAYFNYRRKLNISLRFDKEKYAPREKINLRIRTTGHDSIPVQANLSLAVVNDQLYTMSDDKQHNILSWLMLGSEIKGKVEKPSFYFDESEPKAEQALNYLLLTQGWRRYNSDDLLNRHYQVQFPAEKIGCISGTVKNKHTGEPLKAEVVVVELQNKKRILKVTTGNNGKFRFENADASSHIQVLARSNGADINSIFIEIDRLNELPNLAERHKKEVFDRLVPEVIKVKAEIVEQEKGKKEDANIKRMEVAQGKMNDIVNGDGEALVLQEDVAKLEEVVVVGYGTQKKSDLTGSVATVKSAATKVIPVSVEQILQGKVSGISVTNDKGHPGMTPQVRIRGNASVNSGEPLIVVDGVVYDPSLSGNSSLLQNIPASNIESISVLKDASATAIYGCMAANGVILITTTSGNGYFKNIKKNFTPVYSGYMISPRKLSVTKEFYYPVYKENDIPEIREDFRPTIYWNPNITTSTAGEAKVEFYASDEITTFRAISEGIGSSGEVGRQEAKFSSQLPFSMAVKFPAYLSFGDTVIMPLIITNNSTKTITGRVQFSIPEAFKPLQILPDTLVLNAHNTKSLYIPFFVKSIAGKDKISVSFKGGAFKDAFVQETDVQPKGFPTFMSVSDKVKEKTFKFQINKVVNGSLRADFTSYPDILGDLMSGVESILREPYGCFEQTSSSTYPNIMVLSYLKASGASNHAVSEKALGLIKTGYNRLVGFETSEKGYEWFGKAPAHDGLTAYGLMEFTDMQKVYNGVDKQMVERTMKWILAQRDGKGGFKRNSRALDGFGRASDEVTAAYIVYALSEAGVGQVDNEYKIALNEARLSKDPYRLALMANAAFNFGKSNDGIQLLDIFHSKLQKKGWGEINIEHSITKSYGKSLQVETAALYTLALLKSEKSDWTALEQAVRFMLASRSYGGFGSTQGTILALKALTAYAQIASTTGSDGVIEIIINGNKASTHQYEKGDKGKIMLRGLEKYLKEGENEITVRFTSAGDAFPYTFDASWNATTPASDKNCSVRLKTSLNTSSTRIGETVRLNIKLQNITEQGLPMTMAVVGIPSGLSLQPWQLKEIQEKEKVDFYELSKNYLVLYYRQMAPGEARELNLDLRAEIAGVYRAPASSAYLYYTNEYKHWVDGELVKLEN